MQLTPDALGDRILKVNHAGEHGAVALYSAQQLVCGWRSLPIKSEITKFLADEKRHRAIFAAELAHRSRPRCRSYHLCGLGGFVLGLVTSLCGRSCIAATTVAIETVVLRHLNAQMRTLRSMDPRAVAAIGLILEDERAHRDTAALEPGNNPLATALRPVVAWATEAVIWLGMRL
jgi:ubiquinone biosynthesis monooxygenase Coq7